jgi:hypothetical protein
MGGGAARSRTRSRRRSPTKTFLFSTAGVDLRGSGKHFSSLAGATSVLGLGGAPAVMASLIGVWWSDGDSLVSLTGCLVERRWSAREFLGSLTECSRSAGGAPGNSWAR